LASVSEPELHRPNRARRRIGDDLWMIDANVAIERDSRAYSETIEDIHQPEYTEIRPTNVEARRSRA